MKPQFKREQNVKQIYKYVNPKNLKKHPLSIEIYGDKRNDDILESIRKVGIETAIVITEDNVIVSGHTRNQCAKILDFKEVPVVIRRDLKDELDIQEAIIESNQQREKSTEVKAREFQRLKEIEAEKAKERIVEGGRKGGKSKGPVNLPEASESGDSRDKAAEKVGMSGKTAEKASEVVEQIDQLKADGKDAEAEQLKDALDKSVSKAHSMLQKPDEDKSPVVDGLKKTVPDNLESVFSDVSFFDDKVRELQKINREVKDQSNAESGGFVRVQDIEASLQNAISAIKFAKPFTECPTCKRKLKKTCKNCKGSGYITKRHYGENSGSGTLTKAEREWLGNR